MFKHILFFVFFLVQISAIKGQDIAKTINKTTKSIYISVDKSVFEENIRLLDSGNEDSILILLQKKIIFKIDTDQQVFVFDHFTYKNVDYDRIKGSSSKDENVFYILSKNLQIISRSSQIINSLYQYDKQPTTSSLPVDKLKEALSSKDFIDPDNVFPETCFTFFFHFNDTTKGYEETSLYKNMFEFYYSKIRLTYQTETTWRVKFQKINNENIKSDLEVILNNLYENSDMEPDKEVYIMEMNKQSLIFVQYFFQICDNGDLIVADLFGNQTRLILIDNYNDSK